MTDLESEGWDKKFTGVCTHFRGENVLEPRPQNESMVFFVAPFKTFKISRVAFEKEPPPYPYSVPIIAEMFSYLVEKCNLLKVVLERPACAKGPAQSANGPFA